MFFDKDEYPSVRGTSQRRLDLSRIRAFRKTLEALKEQPESRAREVQLVEYDAAISSRLAAELYGAHLLQTDVEDDHRNYTRFFELAAPGAVPEASGVCGAVAVGIPNEPGALHDLLGVFSKYGVDMSQIVARPIRGEPWKYRFYMEIVGPNAEALQQCIEALDEASDEMRSFGTYAPYEERGMDGAAAGDPSDDVS